MHFIGLSDILFRIFYSDIHKTWGTCLKLAYRDRFFPASPSCIINHPFYHHNVISSISSSCDIIRFVFARFNLHDNAYPSWEPYLAPYFSTHSHAMISCRPEIHLIYPPWLEVEPYYSLFIYVLAISQGGSHHFYVTLQSHMHFLLMYRCLLLRYYFPWSFLPPL